MSELLNLYPLLVQGVFGSIFFAGIGMAGLFALISYLSRVSPMTIIIMEILFLSAFSVGYIGALAAIPLFLIGVIYFGRSVLQLFQGVGQ